jgi:peptide/nickel transport system permease protein
MSAPQLPAGVLRLVLATSGVLVWLIVALVAPWLAPYDPFLVVGEGLAAPSWRHPLGTDLIGRDLFSGIMFGARTSATIVFGVALIVVAIAITVGLVSGYLGGIVDDILMRVAEVFQVVPRFFLAIVALAYFGSGVDRLIIILGLTSWSGLARVVRAETLSVRESAFVEAAQLFGSGTIRTIFREILPNIAPTLAVYLTLLLSRVMLLEASLAFIGLSDPNSISWGYLAGSSQAYLRSAWWIAVFPGLAILMTALSLTSLGDVKGRRE